MDLHSSRVLGSILGEAWFSLLPAAAISSYFIVMLIIYVVRCLLVGPYHDEELERREATVLTCRWIRLYFAWTIRPLWWLLLRSGLPAMAVTLLSLLLAIASGVAMAAGHLALGGWLYIFGGIGDFFDGRLARARGEVTRQGGVIDSTLDRYADAAVLIGLAWYFRDSWILLAVLAGLVGSLLVSYARAKGESVGVQVTVGTMQRPERVVYLGVLVALSPIVDTIIAPGAPNGNRLAMIAIVLLALSTNVTALRRLAHILARLSDAPRGSGGGARELLRDILSGAVMISAEVTVFMVLVRLGGLTPWLGAGLGGIAGALIFYLSRWAWSAGHGGNGLLLAGRYGVISAGGAVLCAGGVAVLMLLPGMSDLLAWALARGVVLASWTLPLQGHCHQREIPAGRRAATAVELET